MLISSLQFCGKVVFVIPLSHMICYISENSNWATHLKWKVSFLLVSYLWKLLLRLRGGIHNPVWQSWILQSSPESGSRAGHEGHKWRTGSKVHLAIDTLGHLLAALVTPAIKQERVQVAELAVYIQEVTESW